MKNIILSAALMLVSTLSSAEHTRLHISDRTNDFDCSAQFSDAPPSFTFTKIKALIEDEITWNRPLSEYSGFSEYSTMVYLQDGAKLVFFGYQYRYYEGDVRTGKYLNLVNESDKVSYYVDDNGLLPGPSTDELDFDFTLQEGKLSILTRGRMSEKWMLEPPHDITLWYFNHKNIAHSCDPTGF